MLIDLNDEAYSNPSDIPAIRIPFQPNMMFYGMPENANGIVAVVAPAWSPIGPDNKPGNWLHESPVVQAWMRSKIEWGSVQYWRGGEKFRPTGYIYHAGGVYPV
jgi:hypothetical protein